MRSILSRYRALRNDRAFYAQLGAGILFLAASFFINYAANTYTVTYVGTAANDLILDHLPAVAVDDIVLEGAGAMAVFILLLGLHKPARLPFMMKGVAVFYSIRSFFLVLTHLAPPLGVTFITGNNFMYKLASGNDLFFSGHAGFPFFMALVFWQNKPLRMIFLTISGVFALAVLLGHLHYSIDVFSAFFIAYGIFHLARWFFKKDYRLFLCPD